MYIDSHMNLYMRMRIIPIAMAHKIKTHNILYDYTYDQLTWPPTDVDFKLRRNRKLS